MGDRYKLRKIGNSNVVYYRLENHLGEPLEDVNLFLESVLLGGLSIRTAATYGYDLLHFYTWLDEQKMEFSEIREVDLYGYIKYQREKQNAAPRSINHRLSTVMQFYKYCFGKEMPGGIHVLRPVSFYRGQHVPVNMGILPQRKVRKKLRVKLPKKFVVPLEIEEVKKYLKGIKKCRDLAIVYLMLHCGLRSIEILNLKTTDISYLRRETIVRGKGEKQRMVYLPTFIIQTLEKYQQYEKPTDIYSEIFFVVLKGAKRGQPMTRSGLRKIFRYRRKITGVERANPHRFRHTCGASLARAGVSLRVIQELFGHENINETINYTNLSNQDIRDEFIKASEKIKERYGKT